MLLIQKYNNAKFIIFLIIFIIFQPSLTTARRQVTHDLPVNIVSRHLWQDYEEPEMPDFDVRHFFSFAMLILS